MVASLCDCIIHGSLNRCAGYGCICTGQQLCATPHDYHPMGRMRQDDARTDLELSPLSSHSRTIYIINAWMDSFVFCSNMIYKDMLSSVHVKYLLGWRQIPGFFTIFKNTHCSGSSGLPNAESQRGKTINELRSQMRVPFRYTTLSSMYQRACSVLSHC